MKARKSKGDGEGGREGGRETLFYFINNSVGYQTVLLSWKNWKDLIYQITI